MTLFERHLAALPHPAGLVRLVQFSHASPGIQKLKRHVAEALVLLLEDNGYRIHNGLSEAVSALEARGYVITPPSAADSPTEPVGPDTDPL